PRPSNCRLLEATEALVTGTDDGSAHLLLVAFESADHALDQWIARAAELARDHGGEVPDDALGTRTDDAAREGSAGAWRDAFLRAPYTPDALVAMGVVNETVQTATALDPLHALLHDVISTLGSALPRAGPRPAPRTSPRTAGRRPSGSPRPGAGARSSSSGR